MIKKQTINIAFIFIVLINVIKVEAEAYSISDCWYYPNVHTIELVVNSLPKYDLQKVKNLDSYNPINFDKIPTNFFLIAAHNFFFNLSFHILIQPFPSEQFTCSPIYKIITFLQKKNFLNSTDDEHPAFLNWC